MRVSLINAISIDEDGLSLYTQGVLYMLSKIIATVDFAGP